MYFRELSVTVDNAAHLVVATANAFRPTRPGGVRAPTCRIPPGRVTHLRYRGWPCSTVGGGYILVEEGSLMKRDRGSRPKGTLTREGQRSTRWSFPTSDDTLIADLETCCTAVDAGDNARTQKTTEILEGRLYKAPRELCKTSSRRQNEYIGTAMWIYRIIPGPRLPGNATYFRMFFGRNPKTQQVIALIGDTRRTGGHSAVTRRGVASLRALQSED